MVDAPAGAADVEAYYASVVLYHNIDTCLIWPFERDPRGRAVMINADGTQIALNARVCEFQNGPAPSRNMRAIHSCRNGGNGCVARLHLHWARSDQGYPVLPGVAGNRGTGHGSHLLTESEVREIRLLKGKFSQRALAELYGVSDGAIRAIYTGRNWAWLDDDPAIQRGLDRS